MSSLDVFLTPNADVVAALDVALHDLRKAPAAAHSSNHALQVATCLLSHARRDFVAQGVDMMEGVASRAFEQLRRPEPAGTATDEATQTLTVAFFLLSVGQYKLGDLSAARCAVERMLELAPHHGQGVALRDRIDETVLQRALWGAAAVAVSAIGVGALVRRLFRS
jgi:hypothetical protein